MRLTSPPAASPSLGEAGVRMRLNIAGPWEMKELDEMVMTEENSLYYDALTEESTSCGGSIGKPPGSSQ